MYIHTLFTFISNIKNKGVLTSLINDVKVNCNVIGNVIKLTAS
jgi:hypothetical protein